MAIRSEDDARRHMHSILPEPEEREKCLNVFADAIDRANGHSRDNWAVTQAKGKVRLIVGHVIVCTLKNRRSTAPSGSRWTRSYWEPRPTDLSWNGRTTGSGTP